MAELREATKMPDEPPPTRRTSSRRRPRQVRRRPIRSITGSQSQKTPKHPVGDSALIPTPTKAEYERMKFTHDAQENKAFREREKAMILDMKSKIEASNKQRWN
jgi:hypothetical protein